MGRTEYCLAHGGENKRCAETGCRRTAHGLTDFCVAHSVHNIGGDGGAGGSGIPTALYTLRCMAVACDSFAVPGMEVRAFSRSPSLYLPLP